MSAWSDYATEFLPSLVWLHSSTGLAAWLPLAMAAHESGVPPIAGCTLLVQTNPWGVRPFGSHQAPAENDFLVYPSIAAAAQDLPAALGQNLLQYAGSPTTFMEQLQAEGWDGPPPASDDYASQVLDTWGPPAQAALQALGVSITTGLGPSGSTPPGYVPVPAPPWHTNWGDILAVAAILGIPAGVWILSSTPRGHAWIARVLGLRPSGR